MTKRKRPDRRFELTAQAEASLRAIGRYTERTWGKAQRIKYLQALDRRFHDLAASPAKGQRRDEVGKGLCSYAEGSHVIFYRVRQKGIAILNILHQRMDPERHFDDA